MNSQNSTYPIGSFGLFPSELTWMKTPMVAFLQVPNEDVNETQWGFVKIGPFLFAASFIIQMHFYLC